MECPEVREMLPAHIDGADGPRAQMIEDHLRSCGDCRNEFAGLQQVVSGLGALAQEVVEPPTWMLGSVLDGVRRRAELLQRIRDRRAAFTNARVAGGVLAAGAAGAAVLLLRRRRRRMRTKRLRSVLAA